MEVKLDIAMEEEMGKAAEVQALMTAANTKSLPSSALPQLKKADAIEKDLNTTTMENTYEESEVSFLKTAANTKSLPSLDLPKLNEAEKAEQELTTTVVKICKELEVLSLKTAANLTSLPTEILEKVAKNLDIPASTCLGLTCRKLYDVHFRLHGPVKDLWSGATGQNYTGNRRSCYKLYKYVHEWMGPTFRYGPDFMIRRRAEGEERDRALWSDVYRLDYMGGRTQYSLGYMFDIGI